MDFTATLRAWLLTSDLTPEQCDFVLSHPRMQLCLQMEDPGGVIMDMPRVLYSMPGNSPEVLKVRELLFSDEHKFFLMMALTHRGEPTPGKTPRKELPGSEKPPSQSLTVEKAGEHWTLRLNEGDRLLVSSEVEALARFSLVAAVVHHVAQAPHPELSQRPSDMQKLFAEQVASFGFRRGSACKLTRQVAPSENPDEEVEGSLEIVLALSQKAMTTFLGRLNSDFYLRAPA